jgi:tetratricopeptide (TPR) repeat protein
MNPLSVERSLFAMQRAICLTVLFLLTLATTSLADDKPVETGEKRDTLLYVRTVPSGAKVLLDGKELGTSNGMFHVAPGVGTIQVELNGHAPNKKKVTIRAEGVTRVELALKPQNGGEESDAEESASETVSGNATQLSQEGWNLWKKGQMAEAIAKFKQVVKMEPKNENAWNGLGWASFRSGKWSDAEKAFKRVVGLNPNHPAALNGLGQIYLAQRKYDLAEKYLLKAAPKAPAAWYGLTRLYLLQGKFEQAEKYAQMIEDSGQADDGARRMLKAAKEKHVSDGLRITIEPQPLKSATSDPASGSSAEKQQRRARERMGRDAEIFSDSERGEIESLYQIANKKWKTPEAKESLKKLVEKYKSANRTGCAILYLGQMSRGEEKIAYLKQAIANHDDCFYGDGVQVGAFARFLLAHAYRQAGNAEMADSLFDEIREDYKDAIDHSGNSLVAQLPQGNVKDEAKPTVVSMNPTNGAKDVDPKLRKLRVTFNVPMDSGCSWCGGGPNFPTIPEGQKPSWSSDRKTCTLPVQLKPNHEYHLGLNSLSYKNFCSVNGVPLEPVDYTFKTGNGADGKGSKSTAD